MSVVGIDLGTTNTVVACVRSGRVQVLSDEHGAYLLPSVVSFHPNGDVLVGPSAKARRTIDPASTISSHKRLIGRPWGSPEIERARRRSSFELREGPGQGAVVHVRGRDYALPEVSGLVLKRARKIAEAGLGERVERAVITVPAHFNELQRASTKIAGRVSGIEVLRILNEPTAAALAYGLGRGRSERIAVYDFGGGTFDCTLLDIAGNVFEVLATAGDSFLGGDDADELIVQRMAEEFLRAHRLDLRTDRRTLERLRMAAEDLKVALSTKPAHTIVLSDVAQGLGPGGSTLPFTFTMTRDDLDTLIAPLVERTFEVTQDALGLAGLGASSFDKVILVGGSTRIPSVKSRVASFFGTTPLDQLDPDKVVAIGAAAQAALLADPLRAPRRIPLPPAPGSAPSERPSYSALPAHERRSTPPPFAAQREGLAPVLVDVTPRALVVEVAGGYTDTVIARNAKIPCERTRRFATVRDRQTSVRVRVAQGEDTVFGRNTYLGEVELTGLRPASRGEVVVAITFEVDADATLRVHARDVQTGLTAHAVLQLVGVADEAAVTTMTDRLANQPLATDTLTNTTR